MSVKAWVAPAAKQKLVLQDIDLGPLGIKGVAAMTDPFGPKLPSMTMPASLHQEPVLE